MPKWQILLLKINVELFLIFHLIKSDQQEV